MQDRDQKRSENITLEALLQFKRSERPSPEFWDTFERELHEKQLSALLHKESRWVPLHRVAVRWFAPVGAVALALAAVFGVRSQLPAPEAAPLVAGGSSGSALFQPTTFPQPSGYEPMQDSARELPATRDLPTMYAGIDEADDYAAGWDYLAGVVEEEDVSDTWGNVAAQLVPVLANGSNQAATKVLPLDRSDSGIARAFRTLEAFVLSSPDISFREIAESSEFAGQPFQARNERWSFQQVGFGFDAPNRINAPSRKRPAQYVVDASMLDAVGRLDMTGSSLSIRF